MTFEVALGDNFFDPDQFTASPGQQVTFELNSEGAAIHNMRYAGEDGQYNTDDDVVSDPDIVNPGETAALTFSAPEQPGEYLLRCDFHPVESTGTLTVEG